MKRDYPGGSRWMVNGSLCNMAFAVLALQKNGVREPHWHPNADEMGYCAEGEAVITVFSPENKRDTFVLREGDVFYIPKGYIHHIENVSGGESRFILAYDHSMPQDLDLSECIGSMSAHVLSATFSSDKKAFEGLKKKAKDVFIFQKKKSVHPTSFSSSHLFHLEQIEPQIATKGGLARIANSKNFSLLKHLALFSLRIFKEGIREPHWHPNATELNYVVSGKARLTILSPGGKKDSFELVKGQGSVIPAGFFHHIENIGPSELHMTVYFNHETPDDIGLSGALSVYSDEVLASLFSMDIAFFAKLQKFQKDRMIVCGGG